MQELEERARQRVQEALHSPFRRLAARTWPADVDETDLLDIGKSLTEGVGDLWDPLDQGLTQDQPQGTCLVSIQRLGQLSPALGLGQELSFRHVGAGQTLGLVGCRLGLAHLPIHIGAGKACGPCR